MSFTVKVLGKGQLSDTEATLYTPSGSATSIVKTITLVNTDVDIVNVNLYYNDGVSSYRLIPKDCELGIGYSLEFDQEITITNGHSITGDASVENVIDYLVFGVEKA